MTTTEETTMHKLTILPAGFTALELHGDMTTTEIGYRYAYGPIELVSRFPAPERGSRPWIPMELAEFFRKNPSAA